ncbi:MAG: CapA family protein [Candidatus Falkowbacteria bacterium]
MITWRFKNSKLWFWIISPLVILIFICLPFFLTEGGVYIPAAIFSKISNKNNHLPSVSPTGSTSNLPENILIFGGDIMLSRNVEAKMEKYNDYSWPFIKISSLFSGADLAIANLESPFLVTNNYQVPVGSFSFKANPKSMAGLSLSGFDVLSLANNHMLNQGAKGLSDTEKILDQAGVSYTGLASKNLVVKESHGIKFAFLSYTYAADSKSLANMLDFSHAQSDIKTAKEKADVVIVLMHAGTEYTRTPNNQQIKFAHAVIDAGADLVIGSHPHWIQSAEKYQGKMIFYSLGNLIFDQMWSLGTKTGLALKLHFTGKDLSQIEYLPLSIKDYGQADLMPDSQNRAAILKFLEN